MCEPDAPERCVQPLDAGELAPFSGQLLTTPKAIELGLAAEHCQDRIDLEVSRTSSTASVAARYRDDLARAHLRSLEQERDLWRASAEAKTTYWYESPLVVALSTLGVTLAGVYLATRVVALGAK